MDMQNYTIPFANTGDTEEFSVDTDPSGKVSLEKGWTELYQLRPEEGGLFILRRVFNQMMKLVSTDTVTWKTQSFPNWIDDKGDGLPFAYPKNAIVKYIDGNTYVSKVDNNTSIPTDTNNWVNFEDFGGSDRIGLIDYGYVAKSYHIVAFGGEFNRADYPKLWAYLQANPSLVKTKLDWQDEATTNGGICGFFSDGNGTTTFRVPNLDKAFLRPDSRTVASYQGDAIRNITGSFSGNGNSTRFKDTTQAFYGTTNKTSDIGTGSGSGFETIRLDASLVVPTATENRPKNIAVLPLIVAK